MDGCLACSGTPAPPVLIIASRHRKASEKSLRDARAHPALAGCRPNRREHCSACSSHIPVTYQDRMPHRHRPLATLALRSLRWSWVQLRAAGNTVTGHKSGSPKSPYQVRSRDAPNFEKMSRVLVLSYEWQVIIIHHVNVSEGDRG